MIRTSGVSLLLAALLALPGCGTADPGRAVPGATDVESPATGAVPETRQVVCRDGEPVSGALDHLMEARGESTPEQAALPLLRPAADEHLGVDERPSAATVYLVRADGTVAAALDLAATSSDGWVVEGLEGCEESLDLQISR